ncbi:MAG: histidine kinase dimerization/phospho-acceptor domain-containing protein, partial [Pseudomonadota bacterium]
MSVELSVVIALLSLVVGVAIGVLWARRRSADTAAAAERDLRQSMLRLEARAADAEREVTAISEELDQFSYIASHDLRAPLRAIANLAGFLKEDISDRIPEDSAKHLDMILQRVARLDASILGLLAYSRVSRNEEPAVVSDIDS